MINIFKWFRRDRTPKKFVSWYRDARPWMNHKNYLAKSWDGDGYVYTTDKAAAHRFDTEAEARKKCPVYDGSGGIEKRVGVECVST